MQNFNPYSKSLEKYITNHGSDRENIAWDELLNFDSMDLILREYLTKEEMKEAGSYFTGQQLATAAVGYFDKSIDNNSKVLDPACGAGNLLIEYSRRLEVHNNLSQTLENWGERLFGFDIHQSFVDCAKFRLIIEAIKRGCQIDCSIDDSLNLLSNIIVKDAMSATNEDVANITHVVMNPPFVNWTPGKGQLWGSGKVNAAAVMLSHYLDIMPNGCEFSAILPEVIRTGTRYAPLREFASSKLTAECNIWGRFNKKTDADVFQLYGKKASSDKKINWQKEYQSDNILSDKFDVFIGPLVAYRDTQEGDEYPYVHAKNCVNGSEINNIKEKRRFLGKVVESPFVVIKRTSSPSDKLRAAASIISVKNAKVAVENHLIVVKPKSNSISECRSLLQHLQSDFVNEYFNQVIRMRHLTVSSIKKIPLPDNL